MLFRIVCDCGREGLATSLPRMQRCSACDAVRLFRTADGDPVLVKLAAAEETRREPVERSGAA
jgi:hypothetical protein